MYQPSTSETAAEAAQPERETVIKFVISGPFLNAEAAHTQWATEPPPSSTVMQNLVRRIADLERRLDEERALVEILSRQLPTVPVPVPEPEFGVAPVAGLSTAVEPAPGLEVETLADPAPRTDADLPPAVEPAPWLEVNTLADPAPRTDADMPWSRVAGSIAAPPPPPLSTAARTPPPKVRGLRRMIGALRR
jgi:hypothetical protein